MEHAVNNKRLTKAMAREMVTMELVTDLSKGAINKTYTIKHINTSDEEMKEFLFTLGCYEGEHITIISILAENYVVSIKDARYSIDTELAEAIEI